MRACGKDWRSERRTLENITKSPISSSRMSTMERIRLRSMGPLRRGRRAKNRRIDAAAYRSRAVNREYDPKIAVDGVIRAGAIMDDPQTSSSGRRGGFLPSSPVRVTTVVVVIIVTFAGVSLDIIQHHADHVGAEPRQRGQD